jgi:hypothetical protein
VPLRWSSRSGTTGATDAARRGFMSANAHDLSFKLVL